jgi:hypothetical protein
MEGTIFKYTDKEGKEVKAVAFNDEQTPAFSDYGKVFLHVLNEDYAFKTNKEGKKIIAVKDASCLTQIGFWD